MKDYIELSPRVGTVTSVDVECPFSDTGKHKVTVFLDREDNLMYATSTCLERHGSDALEGIKDMAQDSTQKFCYQPVELLHKIADGDLDKYSVTWDSEILRAISNQIHTVRNDKRYKRRPEIKIETNYTLNIYKKADRLEQLANRLSARNMHFRVEKEHIEIRHKKDIIAIRRADGTLDIFRWKLAEVAPHIWDMNRLEFARSKIPKEGYCDACKKHYRLLGKHLSGKRHQERMVEFLTIFLSIFSSEGLKKLNREGLEGFVPEGRRKPKPVQASYGNLLEEQHGRYPF